MKVETPKDGDIYGWIQKKQSPKISVMSPSELLVYYLTRRKSNVDQLNTGPSQKINLLIELRIEELGLSYDTLKEASIEDVEQMITNYRKESR